MQIDTHQALDILHRLQSVAPASTAEKLGEIADLIERLTGETEQLREQAKTLSDENTYLNALLYEDELPSQPTPLQLPAPSSPQALPLGANFNVLDLLGIAQNELREPEPEPEAEPQAAFQRLAVGQGTVDSTMLAQVGDCVRPPLIAIRGRAELVQAGFLGQITPEQDHWLQAINENTERAFAVLDSVQEMIALEKHEVSIEASDFPASELMNEALSRVRDRAKQFKHEVNIQTPPHVPNVQADFYRSLIILTDLLDNAIRYTAPGGDIRMSVESLGALVLFNVIDNGIGLMTADMENIGRPFWRGEHHRLVRQHTGTGLRLHLAKRLLALQGGELIFSGEAGVGSTFSFTLPTA